MIRDISLFDGKIKLTVEEKNNGIVIKDIQNIIENNYYLIFLNDNQIKINDYIVLDKVNNFKIINFFGDKEKDSVGIINSINKKDLLELNTKESYYDLKIDLREEKQILKTDELFSLFFNEKPLFFKFKTKLENFKESDFKLYSQDGYEQKFIYNDLIKEQFIYFSPEYNKKYFFEFNGTKEEVILYPLEKQTNQLIKLNKNNNLNKYIKWFQLISNKEKEYALEFVYEDETKEIQYIKTTNKIKEYKNKDCFYCNKIVKSIKINNYDFDLKINIFNEDYFIYNNNDIKVINKTKNTDFVFFAKEIKQIDFTKMKNLSTITFNKKYIIENNEIKEHENGYLYLRKVEKNDLFYIENNYKEKEISNFKIDYYNLEIDEYYKNNFKSNTQYFKGDLNV